MFTFAPSFGTVFTAANKNCTNVAPGGKCSFSVTFAPGAGANGQVFTSVLTVNTDAGNALKINLTGTRK
jgi:hypothetical protein